MVRIAKTPAGPQLTCLGKRIHHFDFALAALLFAAWALWTDRNDFWNWLLHAER